MTIKDVQLETKSFINNNDKSRKILNTSKEQDDSLQIKVYKKRWIILLIYILFTLGYKCQYLQYTIILNIITRYYDVSTLAVQCTSMIFNLSVPIMIYPCTLIMSRWGLRNTMILASATTSIGTWIKYFGTSPDGFILTMIGQTLVGAWQVFVISLPGGLAARWFGPTQVATATALGYIGFRIGIAIMSLLTPIVVRMHENMEDISGDLKSLLLPQAIYCTCITVLILIFLEEEPKLPPSKSRALQKLNKVKINFWSSLGRLMKNKNFLFVWTAQSILIGQLLAIMSLLNAFYLIHFKNGEKDAGRIGLIILLSGIVGSLLFSRILDKSKKFKTVAVFLYAACLLSLIILATSLYLEIKWITFVAAGIYGLFFFGYNPICFEISIEISYPIAESFSISILLLGNQIFSGLMIIISDKLLLYYNDIAVFIFFFVLGLIGFILTILTEDVRQRQTAGNGNLSKTTENC